MSTTLSATTLLAVPLAPLVGSALAGILGTTFGGNVIGRRASHSLTILGVLVAFVISAMTLKSVALDGARFNETIPGPVPGTHALVERLAARGVPLFCLTNFGDEFWQAFRPTQPIFDHFADIIVSGVEKVATGPGRRAWLPGSRTLPPDKRSHINDPAPIPTEKAVSRIANTSGAPCKISRAYTGNCAKIIAPKNQNHELASMAMNTSRFAAEKRRLRALSAKTLRLMTRSGAAGGEDGTIRVSSKPSTATVIVATTITVTPVPPSAIAAAPRS